MKSFGKYLSVIFVLIMCIGAVFACGKNIDSTPVPNTPNDISTQIDQDVALLDDAIVLGVNGEYYESGALNITQGNKYVFKVSNTKLFSTFYMYNAKKRMGNNFVDGQVQGKENNSTYWTIKVYDENKSIMTFDNLNDLTSQLCFSADWNDYYEFPAGIYYFVIDIIKNASGIYYFSLY